MKKTGLTYGWIMLLVAFLVGCGTTEPSDDYQTILGSPAATYLNPALAETTKEPVAGENNEELTISVPIQEHAIRIVRKKQEQQEAKLSAENVKELETWWDSLPKPVQSKIKSNEIDIEVVSKITSNKAADINPELNDSQIENTGETLEQIIGTETDMKYTVNTTLIDNNKNTAEGEYATNIRLVKQVPVKLQKFSTDVFLRSESVSNDNIRTLQYWWTNLPDDVQMKIKRQELVLDLTCHIIEALDDTEMDAAMMNAQNHTSVMEDVLNRLVGVYKAGKKEYSIAKIKSKIQRDPASAETAKLPSKQYFTIGLRKNKTFIPTAS